jgi:hypothetical protein
MVDKLRIDLVYRAVQGATVSEAMHDNGGSHEWIWQRHRQRQRCLADRDVTRSGDYSARADTAIYRERTCDLDGRMRFDYAGRAIHG